MKEKAKCSAHADTFDHVWVEVYAVSEANVLVNFHNKLSCEKAGHEICSKVGCHFANFQF